MAAGDRARFVLPVVQDNKVGWGPAVAQPPALFKDVPYQPFSKSDRLGKAADITGTAFVGRRDRYGQQYGAGGEAFTYFHEDESQFQLVDTAKPTRSFHRRGRGQNRGTRRDLHRLRDDRRMAGMQQLVKGKGRDRSRQALERKWQSRNQNRRRFDKQTRARDPSVDVKPTWTILEEMDFAKLSKLSTQVPAPEDLVLCGSLEYYDRTYDRITTKTEKPLVVSERVFHYVTTTDDPKIRELSKTPGANVFATDALMAAIMTATRTVYSWDVVIEKVQGRIFFDKRPASDFDYLTVNETAYEPPSEDGDPINTPSRLSFEATLVNQAFSQQCLKRADPLELGEPNPFAQPGDEVASVGYRYRKWDLGDGLVVVARCEHDAVEVKVRSEKPRFVNIKTLHEWNPKNQAMDWRQKLDGQRGGVLATELKNNSGRMGRWTVASILASSDVLRLGYVSRVNPADPTQHVVLGTQSFEPTELAAQINLNMSNCWGIFKHIANVVMKLPDGKFVLLKDPVKPVMRLYSVPEGTFESEESSPSSEDEDEEDNADDK
eukprot:m.165384 g.165384  ORF g.165384 m.165384 type:complete len:548 (+) comp17156_c0_seq2:122-1765(+)